MIDERDPEQEKEEREATSEGRAEIGPLTGTQGAASGLQPGGTKPGGDAPGASAGSVGTGGGSTNASTGGAGTTAAPPNR